MPTLHVVAGPNGGGKSTLTRSNWFRGIEVIDPDMIRRDVMPDHSLKAAREALGRRRTALAERRSLVVESTLAGSGALRFMADARRAGHKVVLHYVSVDSANQALVRVRARVALGGHDVPEADVQRRFDRSLANLPNAIARADEVILYDNTDPEMPHREVAMLNGGIWWIAERVPSWAATAVRARPT